MSAQEAVEAVRRDVIRQNEAFGLEELLVEHVSTAFGAYKIHVRFRAGGARPGLHDISEYQRVLIQHQWSGWALTWSTVMPREDRGGGSG